MFSIIKIGAVAYAGLCMLVFARQGSYVYYPDREESATPGDLGMRYDEDVIKTEDGESLAAWFVPSSETAAPVILLCHGNAGDRADRLHIVLTLHEMGFGVLLFDYRGYGRSTGKPSEKGTYADARAAWRYLVDLRGIDPGAIVIYGRSLGGAIAANLATETSPAALIVESTFSSAPDMAGMMFPYLPCRWLCRYRYDTEAAVRRVGCPLMVAHSPVDGMIPFRQAEAVFDAAAEPKQFVRTIGDHNSGGLDADPEYREALKTFVLKHGVGASQQDRAGRLAMERADAEERGEGVSSVE
ncbi:MAG: alpha/beta hydrolase [Candidatus Pacebacteria bacterium]|nr:alpha/beta hydrolase [Candidatus Paceibacterota bacterium]